MDTKRIIRHILGYAVGGFVFMLLIPYVLYLLAPFLDELSGIPPLEDVILRIAIAFPVLVIGLVFGIWSNLSLFFTGKGGPTDGFGVALSPRTAHLVVSGPYRYTRNPMVFGAFMCYAALALFLGSTALLVAIVLALPFIAVYLRIFEERRLYRDFGDEFIAFRNSVPMIFPVRFTCIIKTKRT